MILTEENKYERYYDMYAFRAADGMVLFRKKAGKIQYLGVHRPYTINADHNLTIFERTLETPVGLRLSPHTQLAQNIIASYYAGARFFELKTVQKMDGAELSACVNKPCIPADDEGYNCEWSTELTVPDAMSEYIKAWFILHVMAKEFNLGAQDGFQFNISVGYDLEGIKGDKVNTFIDANDGSQRILLSSRSAENGFWTMQIRFQQFHQRGY